eukprot:SAG11_NODE_165_length_13834_cov_72.998544_4_plen_76_part_00
MACVDSSIIGQATDRNYILIPSTDVRYGHRWSHDIMLGTHVCRYCRNRGKQTRVRHLRTRQPKFDRGQTMLPKLQ